MKDYEGGWIRPQGVSKLFILLENKLLMRVIYGGITAVEELSFQIGHFNDYDRSSVLLSLESFAEA